MKLYVFLANTMSRISGGTIYVDNKRNYLENNGWRVLSIDSDDIRGEDISIEGLRIYRNNRFHELNYPPLWYTEKQRTRIISKILALFPKNDFCVIESTQIYLALWGEMLAEKAKAKHIIFNINENDHITEKTVFSFLNYKLQCNELFSISEKAIENLFSNFCVVENPEKHYWYAAAENSVSDYTVREIQNLPLSDCNMGYFGRYKSFLPYVFNEISRYALLKGKKINLILLGVGIDEITQSDKKVLDKANLNVVFLGRKSPVPACFFEKTELVIATAGCAVIAYRYGATVISMNVEEPKPLGFLGYTTNSISYADHFTVDSRSLFEMLDSFYSGKERFDEGLPNDYAVQDAKSHYEYQLKDLSMPRDYYDTSTIKIASTNRRIIKHIFVKNGLAKLCFFIDKIHCKICH